MNHDNQTLIILFLGIALIMSIYLQQTRFTEFILGIFGGIFMQKTFTEHQASVIDNHILEEYEENGNQ